VSLRVFFRGQVGEVSLVGSAVNRIRLICALAHESESDRLKAQINPTTGTTADKQLGLLYTIISNLHSVKSDSPYPRWVNTYLTIHPPLGILILNSVY
jgi:hypothetical protein